MGDSAVKCDFVDLIIHSKGNLLLQGVTCNSHNWQISVRIPTSDITPTDIINHCNLSIHFQNDVKSWCSTSERKTLWQIVSTEGMNSYKRKIKINHDIFSLIKSESFDQFWQVTSQNEAHEILLGACCQILMYGHAGCSPGWPGTWKTLRHRRAVDMKNIQNSTVHHMSGMPCVTWARFGTG